MSDSEQDAGSKYRLWKVIAWAVIIPVVVLGVSMSNGKPTNLDSLLYSVASMGVLFSSAFQGDMRLAALMIGNTAMAMILLTIAAKDSIVSFKYSADQFENNNSTGHPRKGTRRHKNIRSLRKSSATITGREEELDDRDGRNTDLLRSDRREDVKGQSGGSGLDPPGIYISVLLGVPPTNIPIPVTNHTPPPPVTNNTPTSPPSAYDQDNEEEDDGVQGKSAEGDTLNNDGDVTKPAPYLMATSFSSYAKTPSESPGRSILLALLVSINSVLPLVALRKRSTTESFYFDKEPGLSGLNDVAVAVIGAVVVDLLKRQSGKFIDESASRTILVLAWTIYVIYRIK